MSNPYIIDASNNDTFTVNGTIADSLNNIELPLSLLTDCTIASPSDKEVLEYDGAISKWVNKTVSGGAISSLSDCLIVSPSTGHVLVYDATSSQWKNIQQELTAHPFNLLQSLSQKILQMDMLD